MNSYRLSPSMEAKNDSPNFFINFWAVTSPIVGIRLSDLSTACDWSWADRLLGRISVHMGEAQWPHLRRVSPRSRGLRLNAPPSRSAIESPPLAQPPPSPSPARRPSDSRLP